MFSAFTRELLAHSWELAIGAPTKDPTGSSGRVSRSRPRKESVDDQRPLVQWDLYQFSELNQGRNQKPFKLAELNLRIQTSQISDLRFQIQIISDLRFEMI